MAAFNAGNGLDAVKAFTNSGSADAYYMLGVIYEQGCGTVGKNAMLARKNFKKAAQLGSAAAQAKL
jgi:TPR repeat protein